MAAAPIAADHTLEPVAVPWRELLPWLIFAGAMMFVLLYFGVAEQGATSVIGGRFVHELGHDARHLLGVPCH